MWFDRYGVINADVISLLSQANITFAIIKYKYSCNTEKDNRLKWDFESIAIWDLTLMLCFFYTFC